MNTRKILSISLRCIAFACLAVTTMGASKCKTWFQDQAIKQAQKKAGAPVAAVHMGVIGAKGTGDMLARHGPDMVEHWQEIGRFDPDDINTYPGDGPPPDPYAGIRNQRDRNRLNDLDRRIADPRNADVRDNLVRKRDRILNDYPSFNPGRSTAQTTARNTARRTATGSRPPTGAHAHTPPPVHTHAHH